MRLVALVVMAVGVAACDHTEPFAYTPPTAAGPFSLAIPRRLTFNPGDDRFPSVQGGLVAYSLRLPERADGDWCVAVLPDTGGQIIHELCPPGPADTLVDAWRYPALSPDTLSLIFWREQGLRSNSVPAVREFVRATWSVPDSVTPVLSAPYLLPDGSRGNSVRNVTWPAPNTLRFVAGDEIVVFDRDTTFSSAGVAELDLTTGVLSVFPGSAGVTSYGNAPDGGVWLSPPGTSVVEHRTAGQLAVDTVATFPYPVQDVTNAGGVPVAIALFAPPGGAVVPVMGFMMNGTVFNQIWNGPVPLAVAADPSSPVVVASITRAASGGLGNLWMFRVP